MLSGAAGEREMRVQAHTGSWRVNYGLAWAWVELGFGHERSLDD